MLDIRINALDGFHVVYLGGQLTAMDTQSLESTIGELGVGEGSGMVLDLSQLKTIDSCGLSALIQLVTRARMTQGRVILAAPTPFVAGILGVTRLDRWFDLCPTLADAEAKLRQA